jgi:heme-degrading monooxygenase HmoA
LVARYTYLWEFHVDPERREEFEKHYGPNGSWVALFRRSPGYIETLLLRDPTNPRRYLTIDRWESEAAYRSFRSRLAAEYRELDERCQHLTTKETPLGQYEEAIV